MRHIQSWARHIAGAMALTLLGACGGGSGSAFVPQFNVTERELYEPVRAEAGIVAQRGSGGISLQLESVSGSPLPQGGDTAPLGIDKFYFDLVNTGYITLSMSDRMLQVIDAVELYDENKQLLWRMDASNREVSNQWLHRQDYVKPAPRYEVRIIAPASAVDTSQVIAWFGDGLVVTANPHDQAKLRLGTLVSCANCNLSGLQLGAYQLETAYLPGANLRNAWLVRVLDSQALLWDSTQVAGAKMKAAYLAGVDFTGAIVTGAGHSPADFEAAHLYQAIFHGVNLDRVNMNSAFLSQAQLTLASMIEAQLNSAQLSETNFSGSNLFKAQFKKAMLAGTNFSNANLAGADFSNALIQDANFSGADLSGATWTDGRICATPSRGSCQQTPPP